MCGLGAGSLALNGREEVLCGAQGHGGDGPSMGTGSRGPEAATERALRASPVSSPHLPEQGPDRPHMLDALCAVVLSPLWLRDLWCAALLSGVTTASVMFYVA